METELETGDNPEVAATPADCPEEIGMILLIHLENLAIGRNDFSSQQVIDG